MRITGLWPRVTGARGLSPLDRSDQCSCQLGRWQSSECGAIRLDHRTHHRFQSDSLECRDLMEACPPQEVKLALDFARDSFALISVQSIPLIDCDHHRAAAFKDGIGDRLQCLDDRKFLDCLEYFATSAKSGGVDQLEPLSVVIEVDFDGVARG